MTQASLIESLRAGDRRTLARVLSLIERGASEATDVLAALFPHTGFAQIIGITGAPGTGKSSLVNQLAAEYRRRDQTVGIIAVDPTSPFSGGAILGDRIRMSDLSGDRGVFIRSMATRGSLGGLARATRDAARAMDAAGFNVVLIETVGAGQSEVDIVRTAETTLVVEAPGLGDDVQAIKAGILEIADVLVINKADRPGAENTLRTLRAMLDLGHPAARSDLIKHHGQLIVSENNVHPPESAWIPPLIETVSTADAPGGVRGVDDLIDAIERHTHYLAESGEQVALESQRVEIELYERLQHALMVRLRRDVPDATFADAIEQIRNRELDPAAAVARILDSG